MSTQATTTAEHATHWVDDWILRHGVTLTPAAKGALRDLLVDQTAELERGHHRFGELTDERRDAIAERDRLAAELAAAKAEIERLRADPVPTWDEYRIQVYEFDGNWTSIGVGWSHVDRAVDEMRWMRQRDPGCPAMRVERIRSFAERLVVVWEHPEDVTGARNASRAPESPAGATATSNDPTER